MRAFIGYDSRMPHAYMIAANSYLKQSGQAAEPLLLHDLIARGIYKRPTIGKSGGLWDEISGAPMATEFAITRFFVPYLCGYDGYAFFCDSDFLFRKPVAGLKFQKNKAISVVKHVHLPTKKQKMDGQVQTSYARKNWSSAIVFNCDHPKNRKLTPDYINAQRGIDLHQFKWLDDEDIGSLDIGWNHLADISPANSDPSAVHFTDGLPDMAGYENAEFAKEWWAAYNSLCLSGN